MWVEVGQVVIRWLATRYVDERKRIVLPAKPITDLMYDIYLIAEEEIPGLGKVKFGYLLIPVEEGGREE